MTAVTATTRTRYQVAFPADRIEALQHLVAVAWTAQALLREPTACDALMRQLRVDLHALGATSAELDAAGVR